MSRFRFNVIRRDIVTFTSTLSNNLFNLEDSLLVKRDTQQSGLELAKDKLQIV